MTGFELFDGTYLPSIGFGTYQIKSEESVLKAVEAGYRLFDTASLYETERVLGNALRKSGLKREDYTVVTKLWIDEMNDPAAALERSLRRLGMDYTDVFMIHWPRETGEPDEPWKERDLQTYFNMEKLVSEGKVRYLGLSNFLPHHLKNILDNCSVHPAVDQLELHPGYSQEAAAAHCKANKVLPMAWSPFGRGGRNTLENKFIEQLSSKYRKTAQQICLAFLIQKGILPLPKASSEAHIRANIDVFDFSLSDDEISMLSCMPQNSWGGEHPDFSIPSVRSNPENI